MYTVHILHIKAQKITSNMCIQFDTVSSLPYAHFLNGIYLRIYIDTIRHLMWQNNAPFDLWRQITFISWGIFIFFLAPFFDTLTAAAATHVHKAKVMYYYETLNSADYKGSMTSLQSCQSAFSSISRHSTSGVSSTMSSSHSDKSKSLVDGKQPLWRPRHRHHRVVKSSIVK